MTLKVTESAGIAFPAGPECVGCDLCCKGNLIPVMNDEGARLSRRGLEILESEDKGFIRKRGVACPAFDESAFRCRVYEDRPLCCRLFPVDLIKIDGELHWVIYSYCPMAKRMLREGDGWDIEAFLVEAESVLDSRMVEEYGNHDSRSAELALLQGVQEPYLLLRKFRPRAQWQQKE